MVVTRSGFRTKPVSNQESISNMSEEERQVPSEAGKNCVPRRPGIVVDPGSSKSVSGSERDRSTRSVAKRTHGSVDRTLQCDSENVRKMQKIGDVTDRAQRGGGDAAERCTLRNSLVLDGPNTRAEHCHEQSTEQDRDVQGVAISSRSVSVPRNTEAHRGCAVSGGNLDGSQSSQLDIPTQQAHSATPTQDKRRRKFSPAAHRPHLVIPAQGAPTVVPTQGKHMVIPTQGTQTFFPTQGIHVHTAIPTQGSHPAIPTQGTYPAITTQGTYPAIPTQGTYPAIPTQGTYPAIPTQGTYPAITTQGSHTAITTQGSHTAITTLGTLTTIPSLGFEGTCNVIPTHGARAVIPQRGTRTVIPPRSTRYSGNNIGKGSSGTRRWSLPQGNSTVPQGFYAGFHLLNNYHPSQNGYGTYATDPTGPIDFSNKHIPGSHPDPPPSGLPVHPDVRFKHLPFYDVLGELMKPTSLVPKNNGRFQESFFVFHLTPQQAQDIAMSRDFRPGAKCEYTVQVQLRFCLLETSCEQDDNFPPSICVRVNGKMAPLPNPIPTSKPGIEPKRPGRAVDITSICRLSPTVSNQLDVSWASEFGRIITKGKSISVARPLDITLITSMLSNVGQELHLSWSVENENGVGYCFSIYLVRRLTSDILLQRLKQFGNRHPDHTRALIKEKLAHDPDSEIATTSLRVSLLCPLGKMQMRIPCRSSTCSHLQCFDAITFLMMNEKKATWVCPVCDKPAPFDKLLIDGYFVEIFRKGPEGHEIQFHEDGSWSPMKHTKETHIISSPSVKASSSSTPSSTASAPTSSRGNKKKSVDVIDLTCDSSDDEDSSPPASVSSSRPSEQGTFSLPASPAPSNISTPNILTPSTHSSPEIAESPHRLDSPLFPEDLKPFCVIQSPRSAASVASSNPPQVFHRAELPSFSEESEPLNAVPSSPRGVGVLQGLDSPRVLRSSPRSYPYPEKLTWSSVSHPSPESLDSSRGLPSPRIPSSPSAVGMQCRRATPSPRNYESPRGMQPPKALPSPRRLESPRGLQRAVASPGNLDSPHGLQSPRAPISPVYDSICRLRSPKQNGSKPGVVSPPLPFQGSFSHSLESRLQPPAFNSQRPHLDSWLMSLNHRRSNSTPDLYSSIRLPNHIPLPQGLDFRLQSPNNHSGAGPSSETHLRSPSSVGSQSSIHTRSHNNVASPIASPMRSPNHSTPPASHESQVFSPSHVGFPYESPWTICSPIKREASTMLASPPCKKAMGPRHMPQFPAMSKLSSPFDIPLMTSPLGMMPGLPSMSPMSHPMMMSSSQTLSRNGFSTSQPILNVPSFDDDLLPILSPSDEIPDYLSRPTSLLNFQPPSSTSTTLFPFTLGSDVVSLQ